MSAVEVAVGREDRPIAALEALGGVLAVTAEKMVSLAARCVHRFITPFTCGREAECRVLLKQVSEEKRRM